MRKEVEKANRIIKNAREKKYKTNKEYEAIIDLSYLVVMTSSNRETEQVKYILDKLRSGYYDEVDNKEEIEELKLSDDNIQYCFFWLYCELKKERKIEFNRYKIQV